MAGPRTKRRQSTQRPGRGRAETGEKQSSSREVEFGNPVADSEDEDEDESGDDKKGGKKGRGK
jgi:hypothetical protein